MDSKLIDDMVLNLDKSKWKSTRLGDVSSTKSLRENNPSKSTYDKFVGSSCINEYDLRVQNWEDTSTVTSAMKVFNRGEYLLVRRSVAGNQFKRRAARADFSGLCSGDIINIREDEQYIFDGFLAYVLYSSDFWEYAISNASGSITSRVKWKDLKDYEFLLPPKEKQAQLAKLLWAMNDVLDQSDLIVRNLERAKDSTVKGFFNKNANTKSRVGRVRDDSKLMKIESLAVPVKYSCVGGPFGSKLTSKHYVSKGGVPVIRGANLNKGETSFNESEFVYVSGEKAKELKSNLAYREDFIITQRGTLGQVALIPKDSKYDTYVVSQSQMKLTCNTDIILPKYLYYYFKSTLAQRFLNKVAIATGVPHINLEIFRSFPVIVPTLKTQESLVKKIDCFEYSLSLSKIKRDHSQKLLFGIINEVFCNGI